VTKTTTKKRIAIVLLFLISYASCIAFSGGRLPNQTADLVKIDGSKLESLEPKTNLTRHNLLASQSLWSISGQNTTTSNIDGKLVISGIYKNESLPLLVAKHTGFEFNFSKTPYLSIVATSQPDTRTTFLLGTPSLDSNFVEEVQRHPELELEPDRETTFTWLNISYPDSGEKIDSRTHFITINIAERLSKFSLEKRVFLGIQIRQYLIGFMQSPERTFKVMFASIDLLQESPYRVAYQEGHSNILPDGSSVHIIRGNYITSNHDCPYLQRIYFLYAMEAEKDTLYTIFLLFKENSNLTSVRSGFTFVHKDALGEVGTYIDWRKPIYLDSDFEPVFTLGKELKEGDYALVFTPLEDAKLHNTTLKEMQFTYSKIPYSAFVITNTSDSLLFSMSVFLLIVAGIVPTAMLILLLAYRKHLSIFSQGKRTLIKIAALGLAIRLVLAPITAYADDIQIFAELGALYFGSGTFGAQWVSLPGFVYLETAAYFPYALLRAAGFADFQFLALAIYSVEAIFTKLPAMLSDLGSFYYIIKLADKLSPKNRVWLPAVFLLNPLTIYISGILGQFDSIFAFALIASIYYLVANYNTLKATLYSSFAAILNPVGIASFIPLLVNVRLREGWKTTAKSLLLAAVIFGSALAVFFFETSSPVLLTSYERLIGGIPGESFYPKQINFYMYGVIISSSVGYGLTIRFLLEMLGFDLGPIFFPYAAGVFFFSLTAIFTLCMTKAFKKRSHGIIFTGTFMLGVTSLFQLTFPTIFDQFVVWVAGLLLVCYIAYHDRKFMAVFALISVSTGFIYVFTWRSYLMLISGVDKSPIGNPFAANLASALIGALYSLVLVVILIAILIRWRQEYRLLQQMGPSV